MCCAQHNEKRSGRLPNIWYEWSVRVQTEAVQVPVEVEAGSTPAGVATAECAEAAQPAGQVGVAAPDAAVLEGGSAPLLPGGCAEAPRTPCPPQSPRLTPREVRPLLPQCS